MINNSKIEFKVKDEIIAYFKQGYTSKFVSKALLGKDTIYRYGYKYNRGDQDEEDIDWDNFDPKYKELVENAIIAFVNLLKSGRH